MRDGTVRAAGDVRAVKVVKVGKIVSGGQTGVDRAALDFARENDLELGGYVPKGRAAEDGRIPDTYPNLTETPTGDPAERTGLNVLHSDATLIISRGELAGGSQLTAECATKHGKPFFHANLLHTDLESRAEQVRTWLAELKAEVLNVAGPRASEDQEIYSHARQFLEIVVLGKH
jgi:Circularly permutated YpsA SLOG family